MLNHDDVYGASRAPYGPWAARFLRSERECTGPPRPAAQARALAQPTMPVDSSSRVGLGYPRRRWHWIATAVLIALHMMIGEPAWAQHWTFDARRIALGGAGDRGNLASELVAERRGYRTIVLPLGLTQSLSDLSIYTSLRDPADPSFDPVRALELLASPIHYTVARPETAPGVRALVHDLANAEFNRDLNAYADVVLPERTLWEGLASPNWGKTFVLSGARDHHEGFQGVYIGAGPYVSAHTDTRLDPNLIETLARIEEAGDVPANVSYHSSHRTILQAAAAVTGGYRARFPLPTRTASGWDGMYVAADFHYLHGFGFGRPEGDLNFATDETGLVVGESVGSRRVGFYDYTTSRSGRGFAVDAGVTLVFGRVDVGFGVRGVGNRLVWTDLRRERNVLELETLGPPGSVGSSPPLSAEDAHTIQVELPVHSTADVAYHADGWSALAEYGHGFLGHRLQAGIEVSRGLVDLRGGARFLRDRWHPSVGIGFNPSSGPSWDIALFGGSANVLAERTLAIAVSLRLGA